MAETKSPSLTTQLSRRSVLGAGAAIPIVTGLSGGAALGAGVMVPVGLAASTAAAAEPAPDTGMEAHTGHAPDIRGLETLSSIEMEALEAFCARLVPTDERGPGAREARAAHYIDRALAGPLMKQRAAYASGLSVLNDYARTAKGKPFAQLAPADQDTILHDLEAGRATGFSPGSAVFFGMVRAHTLEGMFCDPYYGGNTNFAGWDLIGYPGLRMMVTPEDQGRVKSKTLRNSAYSASMFGLGSD